MVAISMGAESIRAALSYHAVAATNLLHKPPRNLFGNNVIGEDICLLILVTCKHYLTQPGSLYRHLGNYS